MPIPIGNIAFSGQEAYFHARNIQRTNLDYKAKFVVKAQVQTSNRSKGYFKENNYENGIRLCDTPDEVRHAAEMMCGKTLVAPAQKNDIFFPTGEQGFRCRCVYVMERIEP